MPFADLGLLAAALGIVYAAALLFTDAVEHLGARMGVSQGVAGSIFAAIGTAMPETIVPVVAIVAGGASVEVNEAVGMGAILGAPFMLGTVALGLLGLAAGITRGWRARISPEPTGLRRDLTAFFLLFGSALAIGTLPEDWKIPRALGALLLIAGYVLYLLATFRASGELVEAGHGVESEGPLWLSRLGMPEGIPVILVQLAAGLALLVGGARMFVHGVEDLAHALGASPLVVSLLVVPIATELPEKVNSVLWVRTGKDTLAMGNITGAMVFQGSLIPAIGMLISPWTIRDWHGWLPALLALAGAGWIAIAQRITPQSLLVNLALYLAFVVTVLLL